MMVTNNNNNNRKVIPTTDRQGVSNRNMVGITALKQTFFSMELNPGNPIQMESIKFHLLIKNLFLSKSFPDVPLAGRLNHLMVAWMRITKDPKILDTVKGYKVPFHSKLF